MSVIQEQFVADLLAACPETQPMVDEHLADFENEILLHLLISDIRRFAIALFEAGDVEVLRRCLDAVGTGMTDGDDYVQNAIGVSFVEDTPLWEPTMEPYIATWPQPLTDEAERQRSWRPGDAQLPYCAPLA